MHITCNIFGETKTCFRDKKDQNAITMFGCMLEREYMHIGHGNQKQQTLTFTLIWNLT